MAILETFPSRDNSHTILDTDGTAVAKEDNLQFIGLDVTDDSTNNKTEVKAVGLNADSLDDIIQSASVQGNAVAGNGLVYSTTEQIVGKWIDGKPIYQKTVTGTVSNYTNITRNPIGASVETVVKIDGVYNNITPIGGVTKDDMTEGLGVAVSSNSVATNPNTYAVYNKPSGKTAYVGKSYHLTIQYTKTTD